MIIALFLLVVIIYYVRLLARYANHYPLFIYVGQKGSGKTSLLATKAWKLHCKGAIVVHNVSSLNFGHYVSNLDDYMRRQLDREDCIPPTHLFIDEAGLEFDNRQFKDFSKTALHFFKLHRHLCHTVHLFSQSFDVDKKIRDLADKMIILRRAGLFIFRQPTHFRIEVVQDANGTSRIVNSIVLRPLPFSPFSWLPKLVGKHDSYSRGT